MFQWFVVVRYLRSADVNVAVIIYDPPGRRGKRANSAVLVDHNF